MKKVIAIIVLSLFAVNMAGCDSLQRKFTRKKKAPVKAPRIYQVQKYQKKPTPELYKKHYSYWSSWSSELIKVLGDNHKKDVMCINAIVSNLQDMQNMLISEKGKELDTTIKRMVTVKETILQNDLTQANRVYVMSTLEREERFVKRQFDYDKIKSFMKEGFESAEPEEDVEVDGAK